MKKKISICALLLACILLPAFSSSASAAAMGNTTEEGEKPSPDSKKLIQRYVVIGRRTMSGSGAGWHAISCDRSYHVVCFSFVVQDYVYARIAVELPNNEGAPTRFTASENIERSGCDNCSDEEVSQEDDSKEIEYRFNEVANLEN